MTDRQITIRTVQAKGWDIFKPTKGDKTILVMASINGFNKVMVDAQTWAEARQQLAKLNRA